MYGSKMLSANALNGKIMESCQLFRTPVKQLLDLLYSGLAGFK